MQKQHHTTAFVFVLLLVTLFFTIFALPLPLNSATTTDAINITLTVEEAAAPEPPAPPTGGGGPPGTPATVEIINVEVIVATNTATILWTTNKPAVSTLSWGTTVDYTDGTLSEIDLSTDHSANLPNLMEDTDYFFEIVVDDLQTSRQGYAGTFRTALEDLKPPLNVSNFTATPRDTVIDLSWKNPPDSDFDLVRIVRSETFFSASPFEGVVVYEGRGTATTDINVRKGVTYYYSIFASDTAGNFSEGSIARAELAVGVPPEVPPPPLEEFPPAPFVPPLIQEFTLFHIDFIQDGKKIPYLGLDQVPIDGNKELTISVDYERLPEILKTLAITVVDPEDPTKTFSFLLRVTPDKTTYRTTLAPFERGGVYAFDVYILDHQNQGLKKLDGRMLVAAALPGVEVIGITETLQKILTLSFCFLLLVLLLLALILVETIAFVKNKDTRVRKGILIFILIAALITVFVLRDTIADEYFCFAFLVLLLITFVRGIYALLKRFFANKTDKIDKNKNINNKDDTNKNTIFSTLN